MFRAAFFVCLVALAIAIPCGGALASGDLYQATTIVTGQDETNRPAGFADAFRQVLVKVSGDSRLPEHPRAAELAATAASFVADFRYRDRMEGIPVHDEQGTRERPYDLTVRFHAEQIDTALRALGSEPWPPPRPRLAVFVGVNNGSARYMLASDGERGRDQREALAAAADRFGVPAVLPDETAIASAAGPSPENVGDAEPSSLEPAATAVGGDLPLIGSLTWSDAALGWTADWRLDWQGETHRWRITGVSFDAAFRSALAGAAQLLSGNGAPR